MMAMPFWLECLLPLVIAATPPAGLAGWWCARAIRRVSRDELVARIRADWRAVYGTEYPAG